MLHEALVHCTALRSSFEVLINSAKVPSAVVQRFLVTSGVEL